jgi:hypothetical protein
MGLTLFNQLEMGAYGNTQYENHIVGNSIGSISFIHFDIYGEACNIGGNLITLKTEILMGNTISLKDPNLYKRRTSYTLSLSLYIYIFRFRSL